MTAVMHAARACRAELQRGKRQSLPARCVTPAPGEDNQIFASILYSAWIDETIYVLASAESKRLREILRHNLCWHIFNMLTAIVCHSFRYFISESVEELLHFVLWPLLRKH